MATGMNLRLSAADDELVDRLAARYRTTRQRAVIAALHEVDAQDSRSARMREIRQSVLIDWSETLAALGDT